MDEKNVQIIENASLDDVRAGDHLIWESTQAWRDMTITGRREGIAHHLDAGGDWCTRKGAWLTDSPAYGDAVTLTIRRSINKEN